MTLTNLYISTLFSGTCPEPGGGVWDAVRSGATWPYTTNKQVTYTFHQLCPGKGGTITCQSNGTWTDKPQCIGEWNILCLAQGWSESVPTCQPNYIWHWSMKNENNVLNGAPIKINCLLEETTVWMKVNTNVEFLAS